MEPPHGKYYDFFVTGQWGIMNVQYFAYYCLWKGYRIWSLLSPDYASMVEGSDPDDIPRDARFFGVSKTLLLEMGGPESWRVEAEEHQRREKLIRDFRLAHREVPQYWTERDEWLRLHDYDTHRFTPCCCMVIYPVALPAGLAFLLEAELNKQKDGPQQAVTMMLAGTSF